ncbi:hypothetical protein GCM10025870_05360 [Agromyces marinus]|uniref:Carboxyl transferase domain-containing protein n=1 Tax=Agromyces marinus TaxID=1389020 RepID=A0ABN6YBT8_9MICO|nr:hypothetical protein GCM10025870_05360 [Agromyces marinus]
MHTITSAIDAASDAARANADAHAVLADELREKLATAALGGPEGSRERHVARGKLLPRDRVRRLLDEGSPFLELSPSPRATSTTTTRPPRGSSRVSASCTAGRSWWSATTRPSRAAPTTR